MSGLACAIALRRVGHQVTVLEQERALMTVSTPSTDPVDVLTESKNSDAGGIRMPPNLSKILFHWGLKDELRKIAIKSMAIDLCLCASPQSLISFLNL